MSGGGWKDLGHLDEIVQQDSRNAAWLGNALGWDYLEEEGKRNVENPGRAITKAAISAATYGIGDYLAGLYGAGASVAGDVAVPAAEAAIQGGSTIAIDTASEQAIQRALEQAAQQGGQGLLSQGAAPVTELSKAFVPVQDLSTQAGLMDKARLAFSSGSGTGKGAQQLAMNLGMQQIQPQQQQMPMSAPPRQQAPSEPLPNPYSQSLPMSGNSMGLLSLEELRKRQRGLLR